MGLRRSSWIPARGALGRAAAALRQPRGGNLLPHRSSSELTPVSTSRILNPTRRRAHAQRPLRCPPGSRRPGRSEVSPPTRLFSVSSPGPDGRESAGRSGHGSVAAAGGGLALRALLPPCPAQKRGRGAAGYRGWPGVPAKLPLGPGSRGPLGLLRAAAAPAEPRWPELRLSRRCHTPGSRHPESKGRPFKAAAPRRPRPIPPQ